MLSFFLFVSVEEIQATRWPDGIYGLQATMFGCPENELHGWATGYANLTIDTNSSNMIWNDDDPDSFEPHILGPYTKQSVQLNFCIKKNSSRLEKSSATTWPGGNYCIYKAGNACPEGELYYRLLTGATSGVGVSYPSGAPELILVFVGFVLLQL